MAYEKTVWEDSPSTSSPITAANLNHIENGLYDTNRAIDVYVTNPRKWCELLSHIYRNS